MTQRTRLAAYLVMGVVGIGAAAGLGSAPFANAETGTHPHLDNLCNVPAFASQNAPRVIVGARNPKDVTFSDQRGETAFVGLRDGNAYCRGGDVILPPSYGSGPELLP